MTVGYKGFFLLISVFCATLLSGCVTNSEGGTDVTALASSLPQVKAFLEQYPNAKISVVLWDSATVEKNIASIRADCGEQFAVADYYRVSVIDPSFTLTVWLDKSGQNVMCAVKAASAVNPTYVPTGTPTQLPGSTAVPAVSATPASTTEMPPLPPGTIETSTEVSTGVSPVSMPALPTTSSSPSGSYSIKTYVNDYLDNNSETFRGSTGVYTGDNTGFEKAFKLDSSKASFLALPNNGKIVNSYNVPVYENQTIYVGSHTEYDSGLSYQTVIANNMRASYVVSFSPALPVCWNTTKINGPLGCVADSIFNTLTEINMLGQRWVVFGGLIDGASVKQLDVGKQVAANPGMTIGDSLVAPTGTKFVLKSLSTTGYSDNSTYHPPYAEFDVTSASGVTTTDRVSIEFIHGYTNMDGLVLRARVYTSSNGVNLADVSVYGDIMVLNDGSQIDSTTHNYWFSAISTTKRDNSLAISNITLYSSYPNVKIDDKLRAGEKLSLIRGAEGYNFVYNGLEDHYLSYSNFGVTAQNGTVPSSATCKWTGPFVEVVSSESYAFRHNGSSRNVMRLPLATMSSNCGVNATFGDYFIQSATGFWLKASGPAFYYCSGDVICGNIGTVSSSSPVAYFYLNETTDRQRNFKYLTALYDRNAGAFVDAAGSNSTTKIGYGNDMSYPTYEAGFITDRGTNFLSIGRTSLSLSFPAYPAMATYTIASAATVTPSPTPTVYPSPTPSETNYTVSSCNAYLSKAGEYVLASDIDCGTGNGIKILADDVTLDCKNRTIKSSAYSTSSSARNNGIYVTGVRNAVVKNCQVRGFYYGILVGGGSYLASGGSGHRISGNFVYDIINSAILTYMTENTVVSSNYIDAGKGAGIYVAYRSRNVRAEQNVIVGGNSGITVITQGDICPSCINYNNSVTGNTISNILPAIYNSDPGTVFSSNDVGTGYVCGDKSCSANENSAVCSLDCAPTASPTPYASATPSSTPAPVTVLNCSDTDYGISYYLAGNVSLWLSDGSRSISPDSCISSTSLRERYCNSSYVGTAYSGAAYVDYSCANGCSNGACVNATVTPVPSPSPSPLPSPSPSPSPTASCTDSDGGIDYFVYGSASAGSEGGYDCCTISTSNGACVSSGPVVSEVYCNGDVLGRTLYACPSGSCISGACVNATPSPSPSPVANYTCSWSTYQCSYSPGLMTTKVGSWCNITNVGHVAMIGSDGLYLPSFDTRYRASSCLVQQVQCTCSGTYSAPSAGTGLATSNVKPWWCTIPFLCG